MLEAGGWRGSGGGSHGPQPCQPGLVYGSSQDYLYQSEHPPALLAQCPLCGKGISHCVTPDKPRPHPLLQQPLLSPRQCTFAGIFASIPRINVPPQCQVHLPALHLTPVPLCMCLDTSLGAKQLETTWKQGAPRMLVTSKTCSWDADPSG